MSLWKNSDKPSFKNTSRWKMISIQRHPCHSGKRRRFLLSCDAKNMGHHSPCHTESPWTWHWQHVGLLCRKKVAMDIRKSIQASGDNLEKVWTVIFNTLDLDFYKLPPDEQKILKRILAKAPTSKTALQFPAQEKMKTAVVEMYFPARAVFSLIIF